MNHDFDAAVPQSGSAFPAPDSDSVSARPHPVRGVRPAGEPRTGAAPPCFSALRSAGSPRPAAGDRADPPAAAPGRFRPRCAHRCDAAGSAAGAVAIIAIACSAVAVPLDPRLGTAELDQFLQQLPLDALLIASDGDQQGRRAAERHGLPLISAEAAEDGSPALQLAMPVAARPAPDELPEPDAPAFILRSSGTTALKLIPSPIATC